MLMCSPQAFQSDNVHREVLLTWDHYHRRYLPVWLCPADRDPGAVPLLPCRLPVDRRPLATAGAMAAANAQGVQGLGGGNEESGRPGDRVDDPDRSRDARRRDHRAALRFRPGDRPIRGADWELERLLGKGGFGEVWKARNPHLARACRRWP